MNARSKLNSANLLGCLLLAALAGGLAQSTGVFVFAAVVLIALAVHDGGIRPTPRKRR